MKYTISITRDITEEALIEVEADSADEAFDLAWDKECTEDLTWVSTDWVGDSYRTIISPIGLAE